MDGDSGTSQTRQRTKVYPVVPGSQKVGTMKLILIAMLVLGLSMITLAIVLAWQPSIIQPREPQLDRIAEDTHWIREYLERQEKK
jgi:hypothetical protein